MFRYTKFDFSFSKKSDNKPYLQKIKVAVDQGILQSNIRLLLLAIKILSSIVLEETTNPSNPSEMSFTHTIEVLNNLINVEGILNVQLVLITICITNILLSS